MSLVLALVGLVFIFKQYLAALGFIFVKRVSIGSRYQRLTVLLRKLRQMYIKVSLFLTIVRLNLKEVISLNKTLVHRMVYGKLI